jgi:hypothetical protein
MIPVTNPIARSKSNIVKDILSGVNYLTINLPGKNINKYPNNRISRFAACDNRQPADWLRTQQASSSTPHAAHRTPHTARRTPHTGILYK